jgi:predicted small secreted protein
MRKTLMILGVAAVAAGLSACGETPQETTGVGQDSAPYTGVGKSQYQQPGWTVGDKNSWEQQLKTRTQYGMNDYTRVSTQ